MSMSRRTKWKCHIKTHWRWFYCRRAVPTEHSDTGGIHEKELWIHIEYQFLASADPPPPSALILSLSLPPSLHPSISVALLLLPPSVSPTHFLPFFFIHLCILPFFPPSLLPASAQCNYTNGFFPPRLMASDILS